MMPVLAIASMGFRKLVREKIVFAVFFVSLFMLGLSIILGQLTFDERLRVLVHIGSGAIHLSLLAIAILLGSSLIRNEVKDQTILIVLARPVSREQYYLGQYLGLLGILFSIWLSLVLILYLLIFGDLKFVTYFQAMLGSLFEVSIIASFVLLASTSVRSVIASFAGVGAFLLGNWLEEMQYFAKKSKSPVFMEIAQFFHNFTPQLFRTNWRSTHLIENELIQAQFFQVSLHTVGWTMFFLIVGSFLFRKKDLV